MLNLKIGASAWYNLEHYAPEEMWDSMMYMGSQGKIDLYKHCDTRNYLNIDDAGSFYRYDGEQYQPITKEQALENVME
jgi:hypothetical protein